MQQHTLKPNQGSRKRKKRRGIGDTFAGRGVKGQKSRVGGRSKFSAGFEGGQISLVRRMPKLGGFRNPNRVENQVVNLKDLEKLETTKIDAKVLAKSGLIRKSNLPIKILGKGKLTKKLEIKVNTASKSAIKAIEAIGGKLELKKI
jgi:large subunit ribosomal protein L15